MVCTYRNLATDMAFEELEGQLFLSKNDPNSKLEAFVAEDDAELDSEWQHVSPLTTGYATKMTLSTLVALQAHIEKSLSLCALFIRKRNSLSELSISSAFFTQLCREISVPQEFRDYVLYFGRRGYEVEISPPPFELQGSITPTPSHRPAWLAMGVLRFIEYNGRVNFENPSRQWSIRQTALFSSYDRQQSKAIWLFVSLSSSVEALLDDIWTSSEQDTQSPWQVLYVLYHYTASNWRPYAVALMHELERHEMELLGTAPDNSGPVPLPGAEERQALLMLERQVSTAMLAIQSTKADVDFLQAQLQGYGLEGLEDANKWTRHFGGIVRNLNVSLMRFEEMDVRLKSMTTLVSSFLDLNGSYALQVLTQESKRENETMRKLNERMAELAEKNAEEGVTITVLATLTMIYLPFTVVSNFFSTSFVGMGTSSDRIFVTQDCWILFVISVGLTFITIYVWRTWTRLKVLRQYPFWWSLLGLSRVKRPSKDHNPDAHETYDFQSFNTYRHTA